MPNKRLKSKKEILNALLAVGAVIAVYAVLRVFGITCPIKYVTGVSCPGCGMTRAYLCLFRFDFAGAFHYHPLFFVPPLVLLVYLFKNRIPKKLYSAFLLTMAVLFVIIYVVRLISPENDVVVFRPAEGKAAELFNYVFHGGN